MVSVILKIVAALLPIVSSIYFTWKGNQEEIDEANKETRKNAAEEPEKAQEHSESMSEGSQDLEDKANNY